MIWRVALAAVIAVFLCAVESQPRAQFNGCSAGFCGGRPSGAAAYQGPIDAAGIGGAYAAYSCARAMVASYAGSPACKVVDTATGASNCTYNIGVSGFADVTTAVCVGNTVSLTTFCTVTH